MVLFLSRLEKMMETKRFKLLAAASFPLSFWFVLGSVVLRRLWGLTDEEIMDMGDRI